VVIAAGMTIPRHLRTHADPNKSMFPTGGTNSGSSSASSATPSTPATPNTKNSSAKPGTPVVSLNGDQGSIKVGADGSVSLDGPDGSMHVDAKTGAVTMSGKNGSVSTSKRAANPAPERQQATDATPTAPEPPPGPSPEEIAKVEDEADRLNVRGDTVTQSVETLRKQQQAAGYNLRGDIASSEERMQMYLTKGNNALKAQDLKNAQKYFDLAEAELTKLEKFLGH
jgi:hypothetical protein